MRDTQQSRTRRRKSKSLSSPSSLIFFKLEERILDSSILPSSTSLPVCDHPYHPYHHTHPSPSIRLHSIALHLSCSTGDYARGSINITSSPSTHRLSRHRNNHRLQSSPRTAAASDKQANNDRPHSLGTVPSSYVGWIPQPLTLHTPRHRHNRNLQSLRAPLPRPPSRLRRAREKDRTTR